MECANSRGRKADPAAHLTNCADRVSNPSTMLMNVGFGMFPAAMWTRNSGPMAIAARPWLLPSGVSSSNRPTSPISCTSNACKFSRVSCLKKWSDLDNVCREKPVAAGPCSSANLRSG